MTAARNKKIDRLEKSAILCCLIAREIFDVTASFSVPVDCFPVRNNKKNNALQSVVNNEG
jgi:hypothetical protein